MAEQLTYKAIKLQWPKQSTAWLDDLTPLQAQISTEQAGLANKIEALASLVKYQPSELATKASQAMNTAQTALNQQFEQAPYCLTVTPFQMGVGSGKGYNKYLSAPNLIKHIIKKLNDGGDDNSPTGEQLDAIIILFLSTHYRQFSDLLTVFNSLLNIQELEVAQRRADFIDKLEQTRQVIPTAGTLPPWQALDMAKLNVVSQIKNNLTEQVASLQSYTSSSTVDKLKELLAIKQSQQANTLETLQQTLATQTDNAQMQALYIEGGTTDDIISGLNEARAPSYEWPLCAGVCFVGEPASLTFIKEVVSL